MSTKIVCLNLFEGGQFWDKIVTFFKREQADIYCLQEAMQGGSDQPDNFYTIERLKRFLPDFYYYFSPELYQVRPNSEGDAGNLIVSKFPFLQSETVFLHGQYEKIKRDDEKGFSHYPKNLQHVEVDTGNRRLHVFNLHGIWGLDGGDTPERLRMSEIILKNVTAVAPSVLTGDFNVQPNTETIRRIESCMTNVFKDRLVTSFNMRHKTNPGYATAVVDLFFAIPELRVVSARCPDDDVSDHKPLVVEIA